MTAVQWVSEHDRLLRRMLKLPLLWRLAYRLIIDNAKHDEDKGLCLVCAAADRRARDKHVATMGITRQLYCKKCGLLLNDWTKKPRCTGKPLLPYVEKKEMSPIRVIPMNWD